MLLLKGLNILLPMLIIMLLGKLLFVLFCVLIGYWGEGLFDVMHMMYTLLFVVEGVHMMCTQLLL